VVHQGPPAPALVYLLDTFQGTPGTLIPPHAPSIGGPWTALLGSVEITANGAAATTGGSTNYIVAPGALTFTAQATFTDISNLDLGSFGILFRVQDSSNYWVAFINVNVTTSIFLDMVIGGVVTTVYTTAITVPVGAFTVNVQVRAQTFFCEIAGHVFEYSSSELATAAGIGIALSDISGPSPSDVVCSSIMVTQ
jgi:hypothetical protein